MKIMKINHLNYYLNYISNRGNNFGLRQSKKSSRLKKSPFFSLLISALMMILLGLIFGLLFIKGFDKYIENQDKMLCQSAKVSGNKEYLEKCQCFYESGDIKCLQEK